MLALNRVNRGGQAFKLVEVFGARPQTSIRLGDRQMLVNAEIRQLAQAWYNWIVRGYYIQDAFHFLTTDEREFIQTGLTPADWQLMTENGVHGPRVQ